MEAPTVAINGVGSDTAVALLEVVRDIVVLLTELVSVDVADVAVDVVVPQSPQSRGHFWTNIRATIMCLQKDASVPQMERSSLSDEHFGSTRSVPGRDFERGFL